MIHLSARFLGLLAVLSFASINAPLSAGVALDVRHHPHHSDASEAPSSANRHHGTHSKHGSGSRKKDSARPASSPKIESQSSAAPVAVKAVQLPLPASLKATKVHIRAAPLLVQSDSLSYLPTDVDVSIHGEGDLVRVGDRVFSSRILGRREAASFAARSPHHHDHDHHDDDYTKVIINGDNDRVQIHDDDSRHHHHHGDDDYTKVVVNGDNDRVRVHNRALEMKLGLGAGSPLVVAHIDRRGTVEVNGNNQTVDAKDITTLTGSIDIVSMVAGEPEKLGPRIASLFLNQGALSPDGASYPLDASTTNQTQVTIVAQAPILGMEQSLLKIGPHEVPVVMKIVVFDSKVLQHTNWCATYDSRPSAATPLLAKPCATEGGNGDSHEDQRFLWNSQTQIMRPVFLPDSSPLAAKSNGVEAGSAASNTTSTATASPTPTHSDNDFPTYEDGKQYNWPKPGEGSADEEGGADASLDAAKVAAYQSTYSKNSSRPPIMAAAAVAASASSSTALRDSTSTSSQAATPVSKAYVRKRAEGKSVIMVFRPDVPVIGAQEASSSLSSSSAIPTSSSAVPTGDVGAKAASTTSVASLAATASATVTSSLVAAADAASSDSATSVHSSATVSYSDSLDAAAAPTSTQSVSDIPSSTSSVTTSGVSRLAAVESTATGLSTSTLSASSTDGLAAAEATAEPSISETSSSSIVSTTSIAAAAETASSPSSVPNLTSSVTISSSGSLGAAEATATPSTSDLTSTSTVTETHTVVGAKEASSSSVSSSSTTSVAPTTTAAGVLDVKLVSDETPSSTSSSSRNSAQSPSVPTPSSTR